MAIQVGVLLHHLSQVKNSMAESIPSNQDEVVTHQVGRVLHETKVIMGNVNVERTVSFILDKDFWNQFGIHGAKKEQTKQSFCGIKFKRGQVVHVDLGHSAIGNEEAYMHKAIVVANFPSLLVIVPISTDRSNHLPPEISDAILPMSNHEYSFLDRPSFLNVHQIRVVSKNRLYKKKNQSVVIGDVKRQPIMIDLEKKIHALYAPYVAKTLREANEVLQQQLEEKNTEIARLRQELSSIQEAAAAKEVLISPLLTRKSPS